MFKKSLTVQAAVLVATIALSSCGALSGISESDRTSHTRTHSVGSKELRLRNNIITSAKKHMGIQYRYGGKTPTGFDCSGFVTYVMRQNDVDVAGPSYAQENLGRKIRSKEAQPGDLIFFRKNPTGKVYHVAIVYANDNGELSVIHSTSSRGVVIDKINESSYWRTKYVTLRDVVSGG